MCITAVAWQLFEGMPLVLLSNRDEFLKRPTATAHQWADLLIFAGRDMSDTAPLIQPIRPKTLNAPSLNPEQSNIAQTGGTWLGIHAEQVIDTASFSLDDPAPPKSAHSAKDLQSHLSTNYYSPNHCVQSQVHSDGRWALVLNYREPIVANPDLRSRGQLVSDYLSMQALAHSDVAVLSPPAHPPYQPLSPMAYARAIYQRGAEFAGFILIVGNAMQAVVVSNRGLAPTPLSAGLHVFSNGLPEATLTHAPVQASTTSVGKNSRQMTPHDDWYKCERLRQRVCQEVLPLLTEGQCNPDGYALTAWQRAAFAVMSDTTQADSDRLPMTGVDPAIELALSSIFIPTDRLAGYGTRTQSLLTLRLNPPATVPTNTISNSVNDLINNPVNHPTNSVLAAPVCLMTLTVREIA